MLFLEYTHLLYRKILAFYIYFARKPKYWTYIRLLFQQKNDNTKMTTTFSSVKKRKNQLSDKTESSDRNN